MTIVGSRKTQEMRQQLAARFALDENTVRQGLAAIVNALQPRIPRHLGVALASWIPESWPLLETGKFQAGPPVRGVAEFKQRVYEAGIPFEDSAAFIAAAVNFLSDHCGRPLADALVRKVPEMSLLQGEAAEYRSSRPEGAENLPLSPAAD